MHRSEVQKLFGVNEGTLYRAVPKALVDQVKAERQQAGHSITSNHKPRSGRPPKPEAIAAAKAFLKTAAKAEISVTAYAAKIGMPHTTLLRAVRVQQSLAAPKPTSKVVTPAPKTRQLVEDFLAVAHRNPISPAAFAQKHGIWRQTFQRALKHPDYVARYQELCKARPRQRSTGQLTDKMRSIVAAYYQQGPELPSLRSFAKACGVGHATLHAALKKPESGKIKAKAAAFSKTKAVAAMFKAQDSSSLNQVMAKWNGWAVSAPAPRPPKQRKMHILQG